MNWTEHPPKDGVLRHDGATISRAIMVDRETARITNLKVPIEKWMQQGQEGGIQMPAVNHRQRPNKNTYGTGLG